MVLHRPFEPAALTGKVKCYFTSPVNDHLLGSILLIGLPVHLWSCRRRRARAARAAPSIHWVLHSARKPDKINLRAPLQRVPTLRHDRGTLFSINSSSSLPEPVSNIGRFIEIADAPGNVRFSSAPLPSALWTGAHNAALCPNPRAPSASPH